MVVMVKVKIIRAVRRRRKTKKGKRKRKRNFWISSRRRSQGWMLAHNNDNLSMISLSVRPPARKRLFAMILLSIEEGLHHDYYSYVYVLFIFAIVGTSADFLIIYFHIITLSHIDHTEGDEVGVDLVQKSNSFFILNTNRIGSYERRGEERNSK